MYDRLKGVIKILALKASGNVANFFSSCGGANGTLTYSSIRKSIVFGRRCRHLINIHNE
jgi:hypothetical protein